MGGVLSQFLDPTPSDPPDSRQPDIRPQPSHFATVDMNRTYPTARTMQYSAGLHWRVDPPTSQQRSSRTSLQFVAKQLHASGKKRNPILFYNKDAPYYGFTNFSPHAVQYKNQLYPTSEHLFQSFKFLRHRPRIAEYIRTCSPRPSVAFSEARRYQSEVRPDWMLINIRKMREVLWYKFTQHASLRNELLSTGDAELIEDSPVDAFWGIGKNGDGRNELGRALMDLRRKLRGYSNQ